MIFMLVAALIVASPVSAQVQNDAYDPSPARQSQNPPKKKKKGSGDNTVTLGLEFSPMIPTSLFGSTNRSVVNSINLPDYKKSFRFAVDPVFSYRFGASIRFDIFKIKKMALSNQFALYTGLYYNQRQFRIRISDETNPNESIVKVQDSYKFTSYEIPIMGQLQLRASERIWMSVATGLGLELYPSHVYVPTGAEQNKGKAGYYLSYTAKKALIVPAFKANFGVEYRTEKAGFFHISATYHLPLPYMADNYLEYQNENGDPNNPALGQLINPYSSADKPYGDPNRPIRLNGMYLSLDLKYFFVPSKRVIETEPLYNRRPKKKPVR
jgi:hypothetical protein